MCVCVCVRERERERESLKKIFYRCQRSVSFLGGVSKAVKACVALNRISNSTTHLQGTGDRLRQSHHRRPVFVYIALGSKCGYFTRAARCLGIRLTNEYDNYFDKDTASIARGPLAYTSL